jgi:CubicO group peptidase (beta-lactamase class C family)
VTTIGDYFTFSQMMLNGGEINGVRILGRKTVEYLSSNHLPAHLVPFQPNALGEGFGSTMSVTLAPGQSSFMGSKDDYG